MEAFTPRNVAKFVAKTIVAGKAAQITEDAITNHTQFEEDDTVVNVTSGLVGWYISDKMKPYTDTLVEMAADKIVELRANRAAKKSNPSE